MQYRSATIEGLNAFYREAGDPRKPTLIVWGKGDVFFTQAGATAYLRDVADAELQFLDGGHFVLEDHAVEVGALVTQFCRKTVARRATWPSSSRCGCRRSSRRPIGHR